MWSNLAIIFPNIIRTSIYIIFQKFFSILFILLFPVSLNDLKLILIHMALEMCIILSLKKFATALIVPMSILVMMSNHHIQNLHSF